VGIDTFLVIPTGGNRRAERMRQDDEVHHVGRDYVVLYKADRYREVERDPETWGPRYAAELPRWLRATLDPRGLFACPEVGQSFDAPTYADELATHATPLWLPARAPKRRKQKRLMLIALSPARRQMLLGEPDLVRDIVRDRATTTVPGSVEFDDRWIELQAALFDYAWAAGVEDVRAEALAPRTGLALYEDKVIDSARLVAAERAGAIAEWVATLPSDLVARVRERKSPSPASRNFPESLGSSEADDDEPLRPGPSRPSVRSRYVARDLDPELARLVAFYAELPSGHGVLAIRFRA
jgi:hypothetical protein